MTANPCPGCHQDPDAPCGTCGKPFDGYAIHYTTTVCAVCGDVYQIEFRVCEACKRRDATYEFDNQPNV